MHPEAEFPAVCRAALVETLEFPWGRIAWIASRPLGNSTSMTFGRSTIFSGRQNPRHRHPNCDEILHLLSGRLEHSLGEQSFVLEPGDTIVIPVGTWHQARSIGAGDAEMVISFSSADRIAEMAE